MENPSLNRIDFSPEFGKFNILKEENDFIVVNKSAGLLVHPHKFSKEKTLIDFIVDQYPEIKKVGEAGRPGLVHRLDQEVSGLMVIARSTKMYDFLIAQFHKKKIQKEYSALVYHYPKEEQGEINFPLARNKKGKIIAITDSLSYTGQKNLSQEKQAITFYQTLKKFSSPQKIAFLKVIPLTGRTNQIRVHLKAINCPIVGDIKYRVKGIKALKNIFLNRVFLHAGFLGFYDLKNQWQKFEAELPQEFKRVLNNFK